MKRGQSWIGIKRCNICLSLVSVHLPTVLIYMYMSGMITCDLRVYNFYYFQSTNRTLPLILYVLKLDDKVNNMQFCANLLS